MMALIWCTLRMRQVFGVDQEPRYIKANKLAKAKAAATLTSQERLSAPLADDSVDICLPDLAHSPR